eukprot:7723961-Alexandrium_andersonii.AAC.1
MFLRAQGRPSLQQVLEVVATSDHGLGVVYWSWRVHLGEGVPRVEPFPLLAVALPRNRASFWHRRSGRCRNVCHAAAAVVIAYVLAHAAEGYRIE